MISITKLANQIANKLADFINPDDTGHPHKLIARIVEQEYNRLIQEYASTINPSTLMHHPNDPNDPTNTTESEHQHYEQLYHANLEQKVQEQQKLIQQQTNDIDCLVRMLRQTGYGQGQIDAYVTNSEELDELKNHINKTRDTLNASGIVLHANAPDGITINHNTLATEQWYGEIAHISDNTITIRYEVDNDLIEQQYNKTQLNHQNYKTGDQITVNITVNIDKTQEQVWAEIEANAPTRNEIEPATKYHRETTQQPEIIYWKQPATNQKPTWTYNGIEPTKTIIVKAINRQNPCGEIMSTTIQEMDQNYTRCDQHGNQVPITNRFTNPNYDTTFDLPGPTWAEAELQKLTNEKQEIEQAIQYLHQNHLIPQLRESRTPITNHLQHYHDKEIQEAITNEIDKEILNDLLTNIMTQLNQTLKDLTNAINNNPPQPNPKRDLINEANQTIQAQHNKIQELEQQLKNITKERDEYYLKTKPTNTNIHREAASRIAELEKELKDLNDYYGHLQHPNYQPND